MTEGKNRQIRRMIQKIGNEVIHLKRKSIAHIKLGSLEPGKFKFLTEKDIDKIVQNK